MNEQSGTKWVALDRVLSAAFEKAVMAFAALLIIIAFASAGSVILDVLINA